MNFEFINTQESLDSAISKLLEKQVIGLDTEFVRTKTYYPILALIIVGDAEKSYLIDTKTEGMNLLSFKTILENSNITKVLHSPFQDFEIILRAFDCLPQNYFDTQLAAQFLGYPDSPSYQTLVYDFLGEELDKSSQYTNWLLRPLSEAQIQYAAREVSYLPPLYKALQEQLMQLDRWNWLLEEQIRHLNPTLYEVQMEDVVGKIKSGGKLDAKSFHVLEELALYRERISKERNLPRKWVFDDALLTAIAKEKPDNLDKLQNIAGVSSKILQRHGGIILELVARGMAKNDTTYKPKRPPTETERRAAEELRERVIKKATELKISASLIAPLSEIKKYVRNPESSILSHGWRSELMK